MTTSHSTDSKKSDAKHTTTPHESKKSHETDHSPSSHAHPAVKKKDSSHAK